MHKRNHKYLGRFSLRYFYAKWGDEIEPETDVKAAPVFYSFLEVS